MSRWHHLLWGRETASFHVSYQVTVVSYMSSERLFCIREEIILYSKLICKEYFICVQCLRSIFYLWATGFITISYDLCSLAAVFICFLTKSECLLLWNNPENPIIGIWIMLLNKSVEYLLIKCCSNDANRFSMCALALVYWCVIFKLQWTTETVQCSKCFFYLTPHQFYPELLNLTQWKLQIK